MWLGSLVSAIAYAPLGIWALATDRAEPLVWLGAVLVSGAIHTLYFVLLQRGYSVGDVSVVYPLARGTGPLLTVVFAIVLLGERPGVLGLLGAALVVAGVVVIGLSGRGPASRSRAPLGPSLLFGVATGATIAAYTLWDARAVTVLAILPLALSWGSTLTESVLLAPVVARKRDRTREVLRLHWREAVVVGLLSPLAYILVLSAMRIAPVSLVAPGRELSVVLVSLAGWLLLGEPDPRRRLFGAAVVLAGIVVLAL